MKRLLLAIIAAVIAGSVMVPAAVAVRPAGIAVREDLYVVSVYDPKRDPAADLKLAVSKATAEGKHILLDVGGDWCSWCHILDNYLARSRSVGNAFAASFVILKINWSPENENAGFLGKYPEPEGYPHFYVLDSSGVFLASQSTAALESGRSYSATRMAAFANKWRVKQAQ